MFANAIIADRLVTSHMSIMPFEFGKQLAPRLALELTRGDALPQGKGAT